MPLTDQQITKAFDGLLSDCNGFYCRRWLSDGGAKSHVCGGRTMVVGGCLIYAETCGQPCNFICHDALHLLEAVELLKRYAEIIERVTK